MSQHLIDYLEALCAVYTDAASIGIPVAHVAEWYLEAWWLAFSAAYAVAMAERVEVCGG